MNTILASITLAAVAAASDILVVDFNGTSKATTHKWVTNNDPVMGGQSYSTVAVENGLLNFTGSCKIVRPPSSMLEGLLALFSTGLFAARL